MSDLSKSDLDNLVRGERRSIDANGFNIDVVRTTSEKFYVVVTGENDEMRDTFAEHRYETFEALYQDVCYSVGVEPDDGLGDLFA